MRLLPIAALCLLAMVIAIPAPMGGHATPLVAARTPAEQPEVLASAEAGPAATSPATHGSGDAFSGLPIPGDHSAAIAASRPSQSDPDAWVWPVDGIVGQLFEGSDHHGLDIMALEGTLVVAARPGKVLVVGEDAIFGLFVLVDDGGGVWTLYAHLSRTLVLEGRSVAAGESVGRVGLTGRTSGPHLHFGVRVEGAWRDPLAYLTGH